MRLYSEFSKVRPDVWQVVFDQSVELVETHLQVFKVLPEHVAEAQLMHDFDQHTESLLFRHLEQQRGDQKALSLAIPVKDNPPLDNIFFHHLKYQTQSTQFHCRRLNRLWQSCTDSLALLLPSL